jgi:two-component system sensor histidine kinase CpxA
MKSISLKILLLASLNILLLVLVFGAFIRFQYRFDINSLLLFPGRDRILARSWEIALRLQDTERADWDRLLAGYTTITHASACVFDSQGTQLAGSATALPPQVLEMIRSDRFSHFPPPGLDSELVNQRPPFPGPPPPAMVPVFVITTRNPTRYWVGAPILVRSEPIARSLSGTLIWTASSFWTNTFFFDYKPWLAAVSAVILVSVICWLPFLRGLTGSISKLTNATGAIAEGQLETRLCINRRDELGRLSVAINHMAERLSRFVNGQKRFLGDVAHELCSPIARIQVALSILEQRAQSNQRDYVADAQEDVENMSNLVSELLSFSKAEMKTSDTPPTRVNIADTLERVLHTEAPNGATIETHVDKALEVKAHPELLFRALANVLRNALRYAGDAGPIIMCAKEAGKNVYITVEDSGPGLPPSELEEVFKPFYRPEFARQRATGGVGLGLTIVRNCIHACGGTVTCRNRQPRGLAVEIKL